MTGRVLTYDHCAYDLPPLLSWRAEYTGTVPCDAFLVTCPYTAELADILRRAAGFLLLDGEKVMLRAIVDEYEIRSSGQGRTAMVAGRGYAARLLDNESRAATYQKATLAEIIRNHVTPYGIECQEEEPLTADGIYTVAAGASQWKALSEFCRTYGGFLPRFGRDGRLIAAPEKQENVRLSIDGKTRVLSLVKRENHYGVLTEVLVIDKTCNQMYPVRNEDFIRRGGQCRRVLYKPGQATWAAMRYTGEYQIARSREGEMGIELVLPGRFAAFPGQRVSLSLAELGLSGVFRAEESESRGGAEGEITRLVLREEG